MIIRTIRVRRFKKLVDQRLTCGPGLNVIHGRNDAGKSTLHLAFSAVLYPIRPSEARTYGTWGDGDPGEITVEFEAGGRSYRLHKDLGTRRVALEGPAGSAEDPKQVEQQIGDVVGLASLSLFRATAHISQWDLAGVQKEQQEIGTRLARIVTGGDADAARILNALDDRIRRLEVGLQRPAKVPGPLKRDQDRLAVLAAERQRLTQEVETIERAAAERDQLTAQIAELERQVAADDALVAANRRLLDLDTRWAQTTARARELESLLDRLGKAAAEAEAADRDGALRSAVIEADAIRRLQEAAARARLLAAPLAPSAAPDGAPEARGSEGSRHSGGRGPWMAAPAVVGLVALAAGLAGVGFLGGGQIGWGAVALGLAAALAVLALAAHERRSRFAAEAAASDAQREAITLQAQARRAEAEAAAREVRRQCEAYGVPSVEAAMELAERRRAAQQRQAAAHSLLGALLGGRTREDIAREHGQMLVDLGVMRAEREDPDLVLRRLDPAGFQRLQTEAASRRHRLDGAVAMVYKLEGRLAGRSPQEELARVEEEIAQTEARLTAHRRLGEVLKLVRAVLFAAHRSTIVPGKALLEERAGRYLRELSGGVYDRVVVDEHSLAPRVWVGPPKEWAEVESREIGSGAVDQCYLALRLALIDVLCGDRRPPLFLDDPFLAYDEHRERAAMGFLRRLARERQIFLLTCRSQYQQYADRLIVLEDAPASAPASASAS